MTVNHVAPFQARFPGPPPLNGGDPVWLKKQSLKIREQFEKGDTFKGGESIESESIMAAESAGADAEGEKET